MRLIDADALRKEYCEGCSHETQEDCKTDPVCATMMWVGDAPTVAPESLRPTGEWVKDYPFWVCLNCESEIDIKNSLGVENRKNYCPNCGAKMKGESECSS